ncbi:MAG TPA: 3-deoxy-8-phosphooctulonate synthase [Longimicrobiales bacterium]|nr:3-deoxy-8-phosphooctulonate synthase [Longimicrobiales bacterium]
MSVDALLRGGFFLIAGPCVLEDDALNLRVGTALAELQVRMGVPVIFKASFDKANRSKAGAARGPGLDEGLRRLERVRSATGLPLLTDVHEPHQCAAAAQVVDVLQIPAFLGRQTDLVEAAARTGRALNIKKGQWMAPEEMAGPVGKAAAAGAGAVTVTERGTFLGYGDLVVDMRSFARMREATGAPVVFDGTHSVQRPGRADGASGGDPRFIPSLVMAAMAAGADALFLETHPHPHTAPSDGSNMLVLSELPALIARVLDIRDAAGLTAGVGERAMGTAGTAGVAGTAR